MMPLKAKITSLTDEHATLEFNDRQIITVPITSIEGQPKRGMEVGVVFAAFGSEDAGRQALARDLLNSLFST